MEDLAQGFDDINLIILLEVGVDREKDCLFGSPVRIVGCDHSSFARAIPAAPPPMMQTSASRVVPASISFASRSMSGCSYASVAIARTARASRVCIGEGARPSAQRMVRPNLGEGTPSPGRRATRFREANLQAERPFAEIA